jgi:hypothetical protein
MQNKSTQSKDHYDRARQGRDMMVNMSASGDFQESQMATFFVACTLVDAILALADAVYASRGLARAPTDGNEKS